MDHRIIVGDVLEALAGRSQEAGTVWHRHRIESSLRRDGETADCECVQRAATDSKTGGGPEGFVCTDRRRPRPIDGSEGTVYRERPMKVEIYEVLKEHDGEPLEVIPGGCVRFELAPGVWLHIRPSPFVADEVELRISPGKSERTNIVVRPDCANQLTIGVMSSLNSVTGEPKRKGSSRR